MAEAAAAAAGSVRRSGRAVVSRLVRVHGQNVLRENNYRVVGHRYDFGLPVDSDEEETAQPEDGDNSGDEVMVVAVKRPRDNKPKAVPEHVAASRRRTEEIRSDAKRGANKRDLLMAGELDRLKPFLSAKVASRLAGKRKAGGTIRADEKEPGEATEQPALIEGELRDYQLAGLQWMTRMHLRGCSMILGDEMGLGKTLQSISLLAWLKERGQSGPSLVVCPLSVLQAWQRELSRWAPTLKVMQVHGSTASGELAHDFARRVNHVDVVVTTYEMVKALRVAFTRQMFRFVVLDEGHIVRNTSTQIAAVVRTLRSENRLVLTGTPLQNNLTELFGLLNYMLPDVFDSSEPFDEGFDLINHTVKPETLRAARDMLSIFQLRRLKSRVERLLPLKTETVVHCPMSRAQLFWYRSLLIKDGAALLMDAPEGTPQPKLSPGQLSNMVMQLRKCCNHPYLLKGAEVDPEQTTLEDLMGASGKLAVLDKLLVQLQARGHRAVVFSQFTRTLDIIEDYMGPRGIKYLRLDGSTSRVRRSININRFNAPDSTELCFLMSTRAGGMGINLQSADTVVLFDSDWNPQPDIQAMARVHRIGQRKPVAVYRLLVAGSVEERILQVSRNKLYLDAMVNHAEEEAGAGGGDKEEDGDGDGEEPSGAGGAGAGGPKKSDLLETLRFGADAVFGDDGSKNKLPTDEEIALLLDRSKPQAGGKEKEEAEAEAAEGRMKRGVKCSAADYKVREGQATTKLLGVDFAELRKSANNSFEDIADQWQSLSRADRERKQRVVMVQSDGSGYGAALVPVLAANQYTLEGGEQSVFDRELSSKAGARAAAAVQGKSQSSTFRHRPVCQRCDTWHDLMPCPKCPSSLCHDCAIMVARYPGGAVNKRRRLKDGSKRKMGACSHHYCASCEGSASVTGGVLFPCQACAKAFCEACLPEEAEQLGDLPDGECLNFETPDQLCYVHCSRACRDLAVRNLQYKPRVAEPSVPLDPVDLDTFFDGSAAEEVLEQAKAAHLEVKSRAALPSGKRGKRRANIKASAALKRESERALAKAGEQRVIRARTQQEIKAARIAKVAEAATKAAAEAAANAKAAAEKAAAERAAGSGDLAAAFRKAVDGGNKFLQQQAKHNAGLPLPASPAAPERKPLLEVNGIDGKAKSRAVPAGVVVIDLDD